MDKTMTIEDKNDFDYEKLPPLLRRLPNYKIWRKIWKSLHYRNKMFSCVIVGKTGAGKSWLSIAIAQALDRTKGSGSRFKQENITFGANQFAEAVNRDQPKGGFIIVDDAGLSLYSREALNREVVNLSKIFQSVRFKNRGIILTLPSWAMLDKNVRRLTDAYIEVLDWDQSTKETIFKFQWVYASPLGDTIYRRYPVRKIESSTRIGFQFNTTERQLQSTFPIASKSLLNLYEKRKEKFMNNMYQRFETEMKAGKRYSYVDVMKKVFDNKDKYTRKINGVDRVEPLLLLTDKDLGVRSEAFANKIAFFFNSKTKDSKDSNFVSV